MHKRWWIILAIVIVIIAAAAVFFTFFYKQNCKDATCWNSALYKCERASYLDDAADAAWQYNIAGKSGQNCVVNVKLLELKQGSTGMAELQGKNMNCYVQLGSTTAPQDNLENCHGLLKEEMQKIIINKLHAYITDNLGQIKDELNKAI